MLRRLFTFASAVSLLLCGATVVLWVRSYRVGDEIAWTRALAPGSNGLNLVGFGSAAGHVAIYRRWGEEGASPGFQWERLPMPTGELYPMSAYSYADDREPLHESDWSKFGIRHHFSGTHNHGCDGTMLPWAYVAVPTLVLPLLLLSWAVRPRIKSGHCRRCGYDLRATIDRCPECGESAEAGNEAAG